MRTVFRGVFIISEYGLRDGHRGPLPAELVLEVLCGAGDQCGRGEGEGGLVQGARGQLDVVPRVVCGIWVHGGQYLGAGEEGEQE